MASKLKKENKTSFLKNVAMLMFSQVVVKLLGLVYRVVIVDAEGFGNAGNGYYATGYQIYMVLLAIASIGIPNVISKLVSERVADGDYRGAHRVFKIALRMFAGLGFVLSLFLFLSAGFISTVLLRASGVKYTLMVLAPAITLVACSAVLRGYFAGLGSMKATSNSLIVEQFFNCILSIGFVYACVGQDTAIMAAAGNLSTTCACAVAFFYLVFFYRRRRVEIMGELNSQTVPAENKKSGELVKTILAISVPITLSSLITTANSTIDIFTVSNGIQSALAGSMDAAALENFAMGLYGIMQKAEIVTHLPLAISGTLCSAIVPAIASHMAKRDEVGVNAKICSATFVNSLIIFPCMVGMMVLAGPILKLLYPSAPEGELMLILLVITLPFSSLTYVLNGILYGTGKQFIPAVTIAIGSLIKLILNIILVNIPSLNIYGAIIGTIVYQVFVFLVETFFVYRYVKVKLPFKKVFLKPAVAAVLMGVAVYPTYKLCATFYGNTLSTLVSIVVGMAVYALVILLLKTFKEEDFSTLPAGTKIGRILKKLHLV